jgi:hypothetical protein
MAAPRSRWRLAPPQESLKKILIAILIVFTLAGIAVVGVGYYLYRQARSTFAGFTELAQLPDIERGVQARGYAPPPSEELTEMQVTRLIGVQAAVRKRIGERFADFERKYKTLVNKAQPTIADAPRSSQRTATWRRCGLMPNGRRSRR